MRDREVVASIVAGDPDGLAAAYDRYADPLYKYCRSLLSDPADAADAVQDTFVIAASRLDQLRDPDRLRAWLYTVARNECLRILRSEKGMSPLDEAPDMTDATVNVAEGAERTQLRTLLADAADGLNPGEREVIELQLRQGLEPAEVATVLGVSRNHAHSLLSRARDQLAACLAVLLVGRAGRDDCSELGSLLSGWDGRLTVLLRKRVHQHIEHCPTCTSRRAFELRPAMLLDLSPGAAMAAAAAESLRLAIGAPAGLRAHTLALATGQGPAAAAHRAAVLSRAGGFTRHGFPKVAGQHGAAKAGAGLGQHGGTKHLIRTPHGQAATAAAVVVVVAAAVAAFALTGNTEHFTPAAAAKPTASSVPPSVTAATAKPSSPPPAPAVVPTKPKPSPTPTTASPTPTPSTPSPTPTPTPGSLTQRPPGGTANRPALLYVAPGGAGTPIYLRATGSGSDWAVNWSVTVSGDPGNDISVSPAPSGTLTPASPATTVTIKVSQNISCGTKHQPDCPTITIGPGGAVFTVWTGRGRPSTDNSNNYGSLAPSAQPVPVDVPGTPPATLVQRRHITLRS